MVSRYPIRGPLDRAIQKLHTGLGGGGKHVTSIVLNNRNTLHRGLGGQKILNLTVTTFLNAAYYNY
jgi:hypothetical protein